MLKKRSDAFCYVALTFTEIMADLSQEMVDRCNFFWLNGLKIGGTQYEDHRKMDEISVSGAADLRDVLKMYVEEAAGLREPKDRHFTRS